MRILTHKVRLEPQLEALLCRDQYTNRVEFFRIRIEKWLADFASHLF